eukprot:10394640-Lingulodinium_polyedra.AAC.1
MAATAEPPHAVPRVSITPLRRGMRASNSRVTAAEVEVPASKTGIKTPDLWCQRVRCPADEQPI